MGVYSKITKEEVERIFSFYGIERIQSFSPTITGISNSNFKVNLDDGRKLLLKISNDKTYEQLINEQRILAALTKYNFPYSLTPLNTLKGDSVYQHNDFFGVILPFVEGSPPKVAEDICFQIGQALGALHSLEIKKEDLQSIRSHNLVGHGGQSIYEYTLRENAAKDFVAAFNEIFPSRLQDIPYDTFPVGIIHGDLYYDNSLFNNGKLVTLIDFEQAGRGRFILDLGIALTGCCIDMSSNKFNLNFFRSFIKGYETKRKLITIEKEYINEAILVGFFSIALWRIVRFYDGHLDQSKRYNYRELLERARLFKQDFPAPIL